MSDEELKKVANEVRKGIVTGVHAAKSGHPGGSLGAADIMTYLYFEEMNVDPADPRKADRDRFVLSKGHCAPGLYAVLAERGFFPKEDLETLRHIGSHLQGHPNMNDTPGVDMSTGSLGQGISAAVGMAVAAKHWGDDYRTYALLGDGESEKGQVWEAAMFAGNQQLDNLCVIVDHNGLQIDGSNDEVMSLGDIQAKFKAFGYDVIDVADGNDMQQVLDALGEEELTGMILNLREPYCTPCRLVLLEQHTMAEAARLCGRPPKTVEAQVYRAKKMLAQQILQNDRIPCERRSVHGTV